MTLTSELREAMKPLAVHERVGYLLGVIEDLAGDNRATCHWPYIRLTPLERRICQILLRNEGHPVSFEQICAAIHSANEKPPTDNSMRVLVSRARRKLAGSGFMVDAEYAKGYKMTRRLGTVFPWEELDAGHKTRL